MWDFKKIWVNSHCLDKLIQGVQQMKAEIDMYSKEAVDCSKTKKLKHNLKRKKKSKEGEKKKKLMVSVSF